MHSCVLDIETVGLPVESFDEQQLAYLSRGEDKPGENLRKLAIWPLTGRIVTVGMMNVDTRKGTAFYEAPPSEFTSEDEGKFYQPVVDEVDLLQRVWGVASKFNLFVTFNGRGFDLPYLLLRSAILGVKVSRRDLMGNRYSRSPHFDLLDQLTWYGATRKFSLDFYCRMFGINSPKQDGMSGAEVGAMHARGEHLRIARYCMGDVQATADLYAKVMGAGLFSS